MKSASNPYISQNPFRIIGVLSNSGIKEIHKNLSKLKAYSKLDKLVELDYDFNFLNLQEPDRDNDTISKVESRILLDENKIKYSLFWFVDYSPFDSIAISNLVKGNYDKAIEIWEKATKSDEIDAKNYSYFNNLSTILLLKSLSEDQSDTFKNNTDTVVYLKQAINKKMKLIGSNHFNSFCQAVGVTSDISSSEIETFFATTILEIINKNFSKNELMKFVDGVDENFSQIITSKLVQKPLSNINKHIDASKNELSKDEKNGSNIGKKLIKSCNKDIMYLKEILGEFNYQYEDIADKLSNQILQCGILCYNSTGDDQDYISSYKYALSIAVSDKTKQRALNTIDHCEEEKKANICPGCKKNSINKNNARYLTLYKIKDTNYWSNTVTFNQVQLTIHFCETCQNKIKSNSVNVQYVAFGVALLALIIGLVNDAGGGSIFLGFLGYLVGAFIGRLIYEDFEKDAMNRNNLVREYISEGWQYDKPGR